MTFSNLYRQHVMNKMKNNEYDVVVIGGGITGAGIALDATQRGMKVALVEMQDFAAGTSSRSTKLVHGGLRYLKQLQVGVVAETGKERAIVYENGPHVTTPEFMLLPMHKGGTFGPVTTSIALKVYDFLADVKKEETRKMLSSKQTIDREPLVKREGLKGGGYYVEYRTDDARMTIEVMKRAVEMGADVLNYTKSTGFVYNSKMKVIGINAQDMITGEEFELLGKKVVNASGPWVDAVREDDYTKNNKQLRLTKGVHLVFDNSVFPLKQAVYFDTEQDKRMIFAIPRDGKTYVGTTDTFYNQDKAHPKVTQEDRNYLVEAINYMFPTVNVTDHDIESTWAGIRPLILEEGKDPSEISRKDEIWEGKSGLLTIAGGKLTGYRHMAEDIVDRVAARLKEEFNLEFAPCRTRHLTISGGDVGGSKGFELYKAKLLNAVKVNHLSQTEMETLINRYGSNAPALFNIAHIQNEKIVKGLPLSVYAQLIYSIQHEMVLKPSDFFVRRTGSLYFDIQLVRQYKDTVINLMADILNYTEAEKNEYTTELEQLIEEATTPSVQVSVE
ncbi:glycerol-3-phosphate dehydrogenase/oxidase [Macrococcus hajekii]|uniref:Glycerol-3-phosphate dehydrogenase n=1 Tax=Macrococcus hajekii TaxID=198482 RepID=A0A4R6BMS2_9STAP|nr:glycerol-3-phosphate dehydrogenase/oxidase [Macrococcus hajekii]TDM03116.1 glycerol-3-phosphate dehydrogenase/oxidase [Macrococcus hajekii]GGA96111.1 aerobic glycerol-3-phosphate dehydrogenase [Macrococcus hajekii]